MNLSLFDRLDERLAAADVLASPAEVHGYLTGSYCSAPQAPRADVLAGLAEHLELAGPRLEGMTELLAMADALPTALAGSELGFYPLLPEDDQPLVDRAEALGQWCEGFLAGFALQTGAAGKPLSPEVQEVISDFVAIAQIAAPDEDDEDADERSLMELVEYLRLAAINLYLEASRPATAGDRPALH